MRFWCVKGALFVVLAVASWSLLDAAAPSHPVTCALEIVGVDRSDALTQHSSETHQPEVAKASAVSSSAMSATSATPAFKANAYAAKHLKVSLHCHSNPISIRVFFNNNFTNGWKQVMTNFTGVDVVDYTAALSDNACGIGEQQSNGPILALSSLLYFCDDYHVVFSRFRLEGVQLMGQLCSKESCFTSVVLFGSRAGSSAAANITEATVINNVVGSAIAVAGSSLVSISKLLCESSSGRMGACVFVSGVAAVMIANSSFLGCSADSGGAIAGSGSSSVSVKASIFESCSAPQGGAIWAQERCTLMVADSSFVENEALPDSGRGVGGAVGLSGSAKIALVNIKLIENRAHTGGAVHADCKRPLSCSVTLDKCIITNNTAHLAADTDRNLGYGGGINAEDATVHVVDCIVTGNMAQAYGGGFSFLRSLVGIFNTDVNHNTAFTNQQQGWGGGMHAESSNLTLEACRVSDNYAAFGGGGLSMFYGNLTVLNSNMAGNSCGFYGGLVELLHDYGMPFTAHFHNSNITGGSAESGGCVAALGGMDMDTTGTATAPQPATQAPDSWLFVTNTNMSHCLAGFGGSMLLEGQWLHVDLTGSNLLLNASTIVRREGCCVVGDYQTTDGACAMCSQHMFSFDPLYQQSCSPCPSHATCAGGAVVLADSGFFNLHHLQNCSLDQIYRCPNPSACEHTTADIITSHPYFSFMTGTAGNITDDAWTAYSVSLCSEGYRGVLCGACQLNYGQTDPFSCSPCLGVERTGEVDITGMYGLLAAYTVIFVLVIWGTVAMISLDFAEVHSPFVAVFLRQQWQAESSAAESDDSLQLTDVLKAFIMYAQYFAGMIAKLPISWPYVVKPWLHSLGESWSRAFGSAASLDCLLQIHDVGSRPTINASGLKALINLLLPLFVFLLVILGQLVWWACQRRVVFAAATVGLWSLKLWTGSDGVACHSPDSTGVECSAPAAPVAATALKIKQWCIQQQYYASRTHSWHQGLDGLRDYLQQHWVVTLLVTIFFFYPSIARVAVSMCTCIDVCGSSYWVMDMQAPCPRQEFFAGRHLSNARVLWAMGVGLPAVLFCIGVPISVAWLLLWAAHTKRLDSSDFMGRYGFMYSDYNFASVGQQINTCHSKLSSYAATMKQYLILTWDAVIHVQTVVLVCVSVCGMVLHEYYQTLILAAVIALYLVAVVWLRPFRALHSQKLQGLSYAVLLATCMLLLVFIPPALMDERQEAFYKKAQPVAGILLCLLNFCYVGLAVYYLMRCLFREIGRRVFNRQQQQQQQEEGELSDMKHEAEQHQEEAEVLELGEQHLVAMQSERLLPTQASLMRRPGYGGSVQLSVHHSIASASG